MTDQDIFAPDLDTLTEADLDIITPEEIAAAKAEFEGAAVDSDTFVIDTLADGRREILKFEDGGATARVVFEQDLTAFQDACKATFNEPIDHKSEFRQIAAIPQDVLRVWGQERGLTDPFWFYDRNHEHLLLRAAHDRDLSQFRTAPGHFLNKGVRSVAAPAGGSLPGDAA